MPDLPDPEHVASRPCALGGGDVLTQESAAAHVSDLAELEALAERFGFPIGDGRADDLFSDAGRDPARYADRNTASGSRALTTYWPASTISEILRSTHRLASRYASSRERP